MAGGTWKKQDKILPGVYVRFGSREEQAVITGERGIVAIAEVLSWGESASFIEIDEDTDIKYATGYDLTDPKNRFLVEIFKGTNRTSAPTKVLLYRLATTGGVSASATIGGITCTAKYSGVRGNDFAVSVESDPNTSSAFIVTTFVDGSVVDMQEGVTAITDLKNNDYVSFSGTGTISEDTMTSLTNGADGTLGTTAYADFLEALEPKTFDILIYDGNDTATRSACVEFVKNLSEENGVYVQLVTANATSPDSRFVINVASGVVLSDGTTLTAQQCCWFVGGAMAGASYNESLTYAIYPEAVGVSPEMTRSQQETALLEGKIILFLDGDVVRIYSDINSLVTYTEDISKVYHKNRTVRLCNTIANDLFKRFSDSYIGVMENTANGRNALQYDVYNYLSTLQANGGIQNLSNSDISVAQGEDRESVVVNIAIQPIDSVEKIYMTVTVG